jgi:hypothetical protein
MKLTETCGFAYSVVVGLAAAAAAQEAPPLPKPGPEHAIFKEVEGTWDAKVETFWRPARPVSPPGPKSTASAVLDHVHAQEVSDAFDGHSHLG